jgi:hypothetical protein
VIVNYVAAVEIIETDRHTNKHIKRQSSTIIYLEIGCEVLGHDDVFTVQSLNRNDG